MNRDQKAAVVDEIAGQLKSAEAVFAVDYRGISVSDAAALRGRLQSAGATFRVVKNSLTERAADKAGATELKELLDGPTALTLVTGDPVLAAKALNDTARALQLLEFKGGLMDGSVLTADEIRSLARLPALEVLHGQLVGTIASPLSGLVGTLSALIAGLGSQLRQMADQGLVSGEPPAVEAEPEEASTVEADAPAEAEAAATPEAAAEPDAEAPAEAAEAAEPEPVAEPEPEPEAEAAAEPEGAEQTDPETEPETPQEEA